MKEENEKLEQAIIAELRVKDLTPDELDSNLYFKGFRLGNYVLSNRIKAMKKSGKIAAVGFNKKSKLKLLANETAGI